MSEYERLKKQKDEIVLKGKVRQNAEYQKLLKIADDQDTKIGSLGAFINTQANQIESQKEEIERLHDALISIVDGNWSCLFHKFHKNGLEVWSTDRINPSRIAFQAISYKQEGDK